jgi:hypothetical protein
MSHPEDVYNRKERLEHHLEHHWDGEQENRTVQVSRGEILMRAANSLA